MSQKPASHISETDGPAPHIEEPESGVYYAPWEKSADRILTPFERFVHRETTSALFLIGAAILAMVLANSALATLYDDMTHIKMGVTLAGVTLEKTLHHWVNDGLMALFFFVVGLELKREILVGELASLRKAALPIIAAIGGMVVPALIYSGLNPSGVEAQGWAIPMATDIAFAIGILVLLGNRVPGSLMAFLVALAIADDLGAVLVVAVFYTETLVFPALAAAAGFTAVLVLFNISGIRWPIPYFIMAVFLWFAMLYSGVHPTLAGVIGAFTVPARPKYNARYFNDHMKDLLARFNTSYQVNSRIMTNMTMKSLTQHMEEMLHSVMTPLQRLEHIWHIPVAFFVIPVFALFNAGVPLHMQSFSGVTDNSVMLGIVLGLVAGKFIGITGACWLALKFNLARLPANTSLSQISGAALLAGVGFTMSIFIAQLAFQHHPEILNTAKTGILLASLISGVGGYFWLLIAGRNKRYAMDSSPLPETIT